MVAATSKRLSRDIMQQWRCRPWLLEITPTYAQGILPDFLGHHSGRVVEVSREVSFADFNVRDLFLYARVRRLTMGAGRRVQPGPRARRHRHYFLAQARRSCCLHRSTRPT
ncbi:hypothetical protein BRADI_1g32126v3 [Brachypodium distachyon]|uniref:Uncharacterized protein n=1 Tax=Brachypodium distachyon TaxID=15368 RepID=A0A2K2DMC3_BRADI|nr:hypothetical protein BRADI_1g32126v3 [Brachypodium distachyon]